MSVVGSSARKKLLTQTKYKCAYCGCEIKELDCEVDHIIPKSKGGTGQIKNLVPACKKCNKIKSNYTLNTFKKLLGIDEFWFEQLGLKKGSYISSIHINNMGIKICKSEDIDPYKWAEIKGY